MRLEEIPHRNISSTFHQVRKPPNQPVSEQERQKVIKPENNTLGDLINLRVGFLSCFHSSDKESLGRGWKC